MVRTLYSISVIIPCYNCETTLAATVESVRAAGLGDYELILVDDGSTDGTAALCDALSAQYDRLRCVHQPNAGVSAARNRGIEEARGEYLWFVDADDTVDEGAMAPAARMAEEQRPDMLIFGISFDHYHRGRLYRRDGLVPPCEGTFSLEELMGRFRALYESNSLSSACTKLFRRESLLRHNTRFHTDMILMEDFLFVLEALPHCERISCLPEAIYRYRQGEDESKIQKRLSAIRSIEAFMQPFEECVKQLEGKIITADAALANVLESMYFLLMRQRLVGANVPRIRDVADDFAKSCVNWYITRTPEEFEGVFADLLHRRIYKIRIKSVLTTVKHQAGIWLRYILRSRG